MTTAVRVDFPIPGKAGQQQAHHQRPKFGLFNSNVLGISDFVLHFVNQMALVGVAVNIFKQ